MKFSDDFINRVRDSSNIVDIISQHTELKRSGHNLMGRCPFPDHREKTASFSVSEDKQVYHCFGCKKGGDVFKFLEIIRGMNFPEAVEYLADRAGLAIPQESKDTGIRDSRKDQKKNLHKINKMAGAFFKKCLQVLPPEHPVQQYIRSRGLTQEIVDEFKLGYSPSGWTGLTDYLQAKKVPLEQADNLGLVRRRAGQGQTGYFDLFRDRLMFPILSPQEEVVGFGGRVMGEGNPKYLNSPETPVFHKGSSLYGLHATAKYIRSEDRVIVVEGYMDFLALYGAGIRNVVATLGTALTPEHAKILSRHTKNVLVLFDGDSAGIQASERSLPILLAAGLLPLGLNLPNSMDPDDALKELGVAAVQKLLVEAQDLFSLVLERALVGYRGLATEKVQIVSQMTPLLNSIPDSRLKDLYSRQMADRMGVDEKWMKSALSGPSGQKKADLPGPRPAGGPQVAAPSSLEVRSQPPGERLVEQAPKLRPQKTNREELLLLNLMLYSEEFTQMALGLKGQESAGTTRTVTQILGQSELREIFEIIEKLYGHDSKNFARLTALITERLADPGLVTRHLDPSFEEMAKASGREMVQECLQRIKVRHLDQEAKRLAEKLKQKQDPETLEQFMNIQRERLSLKQPER